MPEKGSLNNPSVTYYFKWLTGSLIKLGSFSSLDTPRKQSSRAKSHLFHY